MKEIIKYKKVNSLQIIIIIATLFIAFCGFSSIKLGLIEGSRPPFYLALFLMLVTLLWNKRIRKGEMTTVVTWTLLSATLSIIPAFVDWNATLQHFFYEMAVIFYGLFFYYVLRIWMPNPSTLMKITCIFCIVWVCLEIIQQFTYPEYWFAGRIREDDSVENRMGLWRFYIWGIDFVMIAFSYYLGKLLTQRSKLNINAFLALIFAAGIICYCSRKHIIALLAVILYGIFKSKSKHIWTIRIIILVLLTLLVYNFYGDYMQFNEEASSVQGTGDDFIRFLSANYFLYDFSSSPLYPILGTGRGSATLQNALIYAREMFHFYRADIGIIGYYSSVGLVGVSAIVFYIYKFIRNWKYIDIGYKLFFIMKMFLIVFDFWMVWAVGIAAYGLFLYLLDENIRKNKLTHMIV